MADLLDTKELAKYLKLAEVTITGWRAANRRNDRRRAAGQQVTDPQQGPPYIKVGKRCIRYDRAEVDAWLNSRGSKAPNGRP